MKRRDALRNVAGAAVGGSVVSGTAVDDAATEAESEHTHLQSEYDSVATVVESLEEHARSLLGELADDGLVGTADVSKLDAVRDGEAPSDNEAIRVMSTVDEKTQTPTAVIRITEGFDEGETYVFVLPEAGRSYAIVEYDAGKKELRIPDGSLGTESISPEDCEYSHNVTECSDEACTDWEQEPCGILPCAYRNYVKETYEVYWCGGGNQYRELYRAVCSSDCCENEGSGCGCNQSGC